jgi:hypothetical protein
MGVQLATQTTGNFYLPVTEKSKLEDLIMYLKDYKYSLPNPTNSQDVKYILKNLLEVFH